MNRVSFRLRAITVRLFLLSGWLFCSTAALADDNSTVDNIKSVYIYNFLSFIQWPEFNEPSHKYRLCVIADQALTDTLTAVVENEKMNGRSLAVVSYHSLSEAENCYILYLQDSALDAEESLANFDQPGTLLIGDAADFVSTGLGMIGFEIRGRKVRVAMNLARIEDAGFKVSSKLLRVVRIER